MAADAPRRRGRPPLGDAAKVRTGTRLSPDVKAAVLASGRSIDDLLREALGLG